MKRKAICVLISLLCVIACVFSSCASVGKTPDTDGSGPADVGENTENPTPSTNPTGGTRICFSFGGQTVYGTLDDNSVSRDLVSRLPLTLTFSDYDNTEKIAYLPEGSDSWDISDAPDSHTPSAGDIAMYSPWGNLSVFCRPFGESSGLVPLGRLDEGGAEKFAAMNENFEVTISLVEEKTNETQKSGILVAFFSCTGNTKTAAEKIAELTHGDLYEIVPADPYSSDDLNYNDSNCRANTEMNNPSSRPAIGSDKIDVSEYDTVIIGYPIWWGTMPRIINTFLDTYDLSGKTVLPFCTSGGSDISRSVSDIKSTEPGANVENGLRVSGANDENLENWLRNGGAMK